MAAQPRKDPSPPSPESHEEADHCSVKLPKPDACCVSPCEPPWLKDEQCLLWYETKYFRVPLGKDQGNLGAFVNVAREYIEFRITYEHRLCLVGKQHGPLLYTVTLLPREKVTLYHSDRYRRISSEQDRYSVQSTFMQFLSVVHEARTTNTMNLLNDKLASVKGSSSVSAGDGGTATAGDSGTATAGYSGTARSGDIGIVVLRWYDYANNRHRLSVGYVREDGIKPNTFYRCDDSGNLVKA